MLNMYSFDKDRLAPEGQSSAGADNLPAWIDLLDPTQDEVQFVEALLGQNLPERGEILEIEESRRFRADGDAFYLTVPLLYAPEKNHLALSPVSFILQAGTLVTIRYADHRTFREFILESTKPGNGLFAGADTGITVLFALMASIVDSLSEHVGYMNAQVNETSNAIFKRGRHTGLMPTREFYDLLSRLGKNGSSLALFDECNTAFSRMLYYIRQHIRDEKIDSRLETKLGWIEKDISSLEIYIDTMSTKLSFLLDTTVGLISVEQNAIIKIFSIVSVVLMPPTLIASIYGMNFHFMPELSFPFGYPLVLIAMICSAIFPLLFFKMKGWM